MSTLFKPLWIFLTVEPHLTRTLFKEAARVLTPHGPCALETFDLPESLLAPVRPGALPDWRVWTVTNMPKSGQSGGFWKPDGAGPHPTRPLQPCPLRS